MNDIGQSRRHLVQMGRRILGGTTPMPHYDAEDVVQDSLIAAYLRSGRWSVEPGDLPMSLHMVTARGRELRRSRGELHRATNAEDSLACLAEADPAEQFDDLDEQAQVLAALGRAIDHLPPAQHRAVTERLAGRPAGAPAERMAHTAAIRNLRRRLEELGLA
jgi:DNA-directed RNA polymerase specialized sigma24 family protein